MGNIYQEPKIHKGITYFPSYEAARTIRDRDVPKGRLIGYERGWAIQYWISGPYYPEHEAT